MHTCFELCLLADYFGTKVTGKYHAPVSTKLLSSTSVKRICLAMQIHRAECAVNETFKINENLINYKKSREIRRHSTFYGPADRSNSQTKQNAELQNSSSQV